MADKHQARLGAVQQTLFIPLAARARETRRRRPVLRDPKALELVRSIDDTQWRLARVPSLDFGIYALGRKEFADEFAGYPEAEAKALIESAPFSPIRDN